ncbi:MAG: GNAT family N-acetyltransferase, partial [Chloroflexi bacterium]|nr:GNAT family N-acetyltransferase [Chloroflexota bacterium]
MTPTIRRVKESDLSALTATLEPDVGAKQVNYRWQEDRDGHRVMLVAELDGEIAGTVSSTRHRLQLPDSLRMLALDVGRAFRRQGIGTALI